MDISSINCNIHPFRFRFRFLQLCVCSAVSQCGSVSLTSIFSRKQPRVVRQGLAIFPPTWGGRSPVTNDTLSPTCHSDIVQYHRGIVAGHQWAVTRNDILTWSVCAKYLRKTRRQHYTLNVVLGLFGIVILLGTFVDVIKSRPTPSPSPATVKFPKVAETALSDDATTHAGCELTAMKVPASNEHTVKGDVTTDAKVTCSLVADPKVSDDVNAARNVHVAVSADCKVINDVNADSIVNDGKTNTPLKMMAMAVEEQATSPSNCCQGATWSALRAFSLYRNVPRILSARHHPGSYTAALVTVSFSKQLSRQGGMPKLLQMVRYYVHRYMRLTPPYAMLIMFAACYFNYVTSGPLTADVYGSDKCRRSWWSLLLYIDIFVDEMRECVGWTWYLTLDFQFYVIAPLFIWLLYR
ncbi:hypothetical protein NP493_688g01017 [Ridgeia piscesae]|uniref:Uncharacterized protein n=1 Tax=Ridgeia piscesae TaxID=27915 RepID=A0AAD9NPK6_RIDPI|nr:hypothetical protein NP493_688g01017 [Ridgeia piscesae]